jgi:hypothetical protein
MPAFADDVRLDDMRPWIADNKVLTLAINAVMREAARSSWDTSYPGIQCKTIGDVRRTPDRELLLCNGFGPKALAAIREIAPFVAPEENPTMNGQSCVKCGCGTFRVEYHTAGRFPTLERPGRGCPVKSLNERDAEHLHCTCERCGYDWCVDVLAETMP